MIHIVQGPGECLCIGVSGDTKPDAAESNGYSFYEIDTGKHYSCNGSVWTQVNPAPATHAASHQSGGSDPLSLDTLAAPTDVTTLNASTSAHGLLKKLSNVSTEYMNGQGNWATPPGAPSTVRQAALQTKTDATLVNATNLVFAVSANTTYRFKFSILFRSTVATVGLKLGLTFPAVTIQGCMVSIPIAANGTAQSFDGQITASGGSVIGTAVAAINTDYVAFMEGIIRPSSSGNLQVQFAAETTGATVTLQAESVGELSVIA